MKSRIWFLYSISLLCSVLALFGCKGKVYISPDFVRIPAGTFKMGSEDGIKANRPVHNVTISNDFYMCDHEVTQLEFLQVMGRNPSVFVTKASGSELQENRPVENLNWYSTIVYCNKLSLMENLQPCYIINGSVNPDDWGTIPSKANGKWDSVICDFAANGYRLPTEAEWEYVARAGDSSISKLTWSGIDDDCDLRNYAWYSENSASKTHEVKKAPYGANSFGIYDMSGNVWEWCWDWWPSTNNYSSDKNGVVDPTGATTGEMRVYRGGSCFSSAALCAVTCRGGTNPNDQQKYLGFRVCRGNLSGKKLKAKSINKTNETKQKKSKTKKTAKEENKDNTTGTVYIDKKKGIKTTVKECYNSYFYFVGDDNFDIYESCSFDKKIGKTKDMEDFESLELHLIEYIGKKADKNNERKGQTWVKIRTKNLEGFICKSAEEVIDPFIEFEEKYPIVEEFNTSKKFTARKMESTLFAKFNTKVYAKPGKGQKEIYVTTSKDSAVYDGWGSEYYDLVCIQTLEITDQTETINGETDYWVKIKYKNIEGWVFGDDLDAVNRGGPRYESDYSSPTNIVCDWFGGFM